ncbi:MAG: EscU/YscU/HrcU family type III secretion system export apparatus switch protein [Pseudomonadota bacterium]
MSGNDTSEEKTLPASKRKLKKQREKGSVVTSKEAVMSVVGIASLLYLHGQRFSISEKLQALWVLEPDYEGQTFAQQLESKAAIIWQLSLELVAPLMALVIGISILTGMLVTGGPVFSTESITPKFEKINPASGFKRVFGRRALMSFMMNVIRLTALTLVFGLILLGAWEALILAPVCGLGCAMETLDNVLLPLIIGAVAVMAVMAMFDYIVQRSEFLHEQKMTITEYKREMKDQLGDPHQRSHLKKERRSMLTTPTGPDQATIVISDLSKVGIGIRYRQGETPAPLVVARVRDGMGIRKMVRASGALQHDDSDLAEMLSKIAVGDYITDDDIIARIAPLLQRAQSVT